MIQENNTVSNETLSSSTNLFKPILLKLFKNIRNIIIQSTEGVHEHPIDLSKLLTILESGSLSANTTITIKAIHQNTKTGWKWDVDHDGSSWIGKQFNGSIQRMYQTKKLKIEKKQIRNVGVPGATDDCLEISLL
eukprot:332567_1